MNLLKRFLIQQWRFLVASFPVKCDLMSNQKCKVRPVIMNINSHELLFYPYSIQRNKCIGSCNNVNDPYAKLCVPDVVKDIAWIINLM